MKVRLKRGWSKAYPELTPGNVYRVLGLQSDHVRLISDAGEPILFIGTAFELVDPVQPPDWVSERGEEGELYAEPRELGTPRHFFELWHDGDQAVQQRLRGYVYDLCRAERALMPDPPNSFIRVHWKHGNVQDPVTLYSELDEQRWEVRKVEVYADGRTGYANERGTSGMTILAGQPVPALDVLAESPELEPVEITRAEFDDAFERALSFEER